MKQQYNTALYMRLSRDDETYGDSVSIATQRAILREYAEKAGLNIVDEYVDDGWSGTNFDRPSFKRMMEDVDAGKINCIITKDLSRFGRDYISVGHYLEYEFPEKHVRYIAVSDDEDTEKGLSDYVPFKNLFNEWFAKDTSRKVTNAFHIRFAAGERMGNYPPIGYIKDPDKRNSIIIDEETRWIIEKIFDLAFHGMGAMKIAKTLIEEKVPTPGWIRYKRYGAFANLYEGQPEEKAYMWDIRHIKNIISDETYIGNSIHNKQKYVSYKSRKQIRTPEEEWFRVENTHEGIIPKEIFEQVQKQIAQRRRSTKEGTTHIFSGLLKCADCGHALSLSTRSSRKGDKIRKSFRCGLYMQGFKQCTTHNIRYEYLYAYVLSRIQELSRQAEVNEEALLERLLKSNANEAENSTTRLSSDLDKAEKKRAEVDRKFTRLYDDWTEGRITEYNFNMMSQKYQTEQQEIADKIENLRAQLETKKETSFNAEAWISLIRQYSHPTELTAELLNTLIEKIVVHQAVKTEDGTNEQNIDIYYRFIGKIE